MILTTEQWDRVYDVLVELAGAPERDRASFIYHHTSDSPPDEFRCCPAFGFGGKLWSKRDRLYVNCYPEDERPEIVRQMGEVNERLAEIVAA